MADSNLVSPGVQVQIIDESFYNSAGPGTIPLIVFATAENKVSPTDGVSIAPGTVSAQAGKLYLLGSQRECIQTFGTPTFRSIQGTPVHGDELNEYGLHAAYQYLGQSNQAYVIRADIDLAQLEASEIAPQGDPVAGTYWLDVADTEWGIFQSNGNAIPGSAWLVQPVVVVNDTSQVDVNDVPLSSVGTDGDFAVVTLDDNNKIYERISGAWYRVGSSQWMAERPTIVTGTATSATTNVGDRFSINGTTVTLSGTTISSAVSDIINASIANVTATTALNGALEIKNTAGTSIIIANVSGSALTALGLTAGTFKGVTLTYAPHTQVPAGSIVGDVWIKTTNPNRGANYVVKVFDGTLDAFVIVAAPFYVNDTAANAPGALGTAPAVGTLYTRYNLDGTTNNPLASQQLRRWDGTQWNALTYEASTTAPSTSPAAGTMWYSTDFQVDIMYGNGENWLGYRHQYPAADPMGAILSGSPPNTQSDGTALVDNDLWIDTSDLENYPQIYRFTASTQRWTLIDNTDQTTPFGIVFRDARADSGPTFTGIANASSYVYNSTHLADMALSDYVDPDAPDPRTFPAGMLLFNTRFSTYNVKQWQPNWFLAGNFDPNDDFTQNTYNVGDTTYIFPALTSAGRWVTASGNQQDGSPYMGRKAQRTLIVRALAAVFDGNQDIRSEIVNYNLMTAPGYPELISQMVLLNTDQQEVSFIIGDTPIRLTPDSNTVNNWGQNLNNAPDDGENGLVTHDDYVGLYYPWALSTNIDGSEIMVPPSTIALRTIAYNDQVAYPWFSPAGFRRGLVTNATTVGYLSDEGEFTPVILNQSQRDTLYLNQINPITFVPGRGLVVYGDKTTAPLASALDRINVARLTNYLRYYLEQLLKPFLFEQNDQQTRDAAKTAVDRFLMDIVNKQGISDFATVCDTTNNTPQRIDQNQLWIDVYTRPVKSINFIYVPIRIRNSADPLT